VNLFVIGVLGLVILLVLIFLRMPIGFAFIIVGFFGVWIVRDWASAINTASAIPYSTMTTYVWTVIPLFMLMGYFALYSGLAEEFFDGVGKWVGHFRGGLASTVIIGNTGFGACTGDPMSSTITFTMVSLPVLRRYKYDDRLTLGAVAAGGMLSGLIPPSMPLILYGAITETSIGKLFIAGLLPGVLLAILYIAVIYVWCLVKPAVAPPTPRATWGERWRGGVGMWTIIIVFVIILGGLFIGLFTPTEAGGAGAFVVLVISLARRKLSWGAFKKSLLDTGITVGMIGLMIIGTMMFNRFLVLTRVAIEITSLLSGVIQSPASFSWVVVILYIALGMFIAPVPILLITVPILYPTAVAVGLDPVHFGILTTLVLMMGSLTPPIGASVFAIAGIVKDVDAYQIFKGVIPFLGAVLICAALLVYFPQISMFLTEMMT
jgi:tripartite ATP-independent transporter DctM subunit